MESKKYRQTRARARGGGGIFHGRFFTRIQFLTIMFSTQEVSGMCNKTGTDSVSRINMNILAKQEKDVVGEGNWERVGRESLKRYVILFIY